MNQRANPPRPADARWAGIRLVLWLFPGVAISAPSVAPETVGPASRPYLTAISSPALRFGEAPPPPAAWVKPAAGAPPTLPSPETDSEPPPVRNAEPPSESAPETAESSADIPEASRAAKPMKAPSPILPDDASPKVRPEDFLPFFQFPGSPSGSGDVSVVVPAVPGSAPAPLAQPRSSATYRQQ